MFCDRISNCHIFVSLFDLGFLYFPCLGGAAEVISISEKRSSYSWSFSVYLACFSFLWCFREDESHGIGSTRHEEKLPPCVVGVTPQSPDI